MNKLKIQEEVDKRATAILQDLNMIAVEFKSHGLPIRVDTHNGVHVWTFDDGFQYRIG
jgi:hypothetical protein